MAEVFGIVTGALGVAALFNNCVECFKYIQLGRRLGTEYGRYQLRIDIARLRFTRWGKAMDINKDARFLSKEAQDEDIRLIKLILEQINDHFSEVERCCKKYEIRAKKKNDTDGFEPIKTEDITEPAKGLSSRLQRLAKSRQRDTTTSQKAQWALYDCEHLDQLISRLKELVDELENVFPESVYSLKEKYRDLAEQEIEEVQGGQDVQDEQSLQALQEASKDIDTVMSETAGRVLIKLEGKNQVGSLTTRGHANVRVGDDVAAPRGSEIHYGRDNQADTINADDDACVQVGGRIKIG